MSGGIVTWVQRADPNAHRCAPPCRTSFDIPIGHLGDLWRCECGALWRIGHACDMCDHYGPGSHRGGHAVGDAWRPATFWQRLRHWRKRG